MAAKKSASTIMPAWPAVKASMASYHCMLAQFGGPLSRTMSIHVSVNFTERGSWKLALSLSSNSLHWPSVTT